MGSSHVEGSEAVRAAHEPGALAEALASGQRAISREAGNRPIEQVARFCRSRCVQHHRRRAQHPRQRTVAPRVRA